MKNLFIYTISLVAILLLASCNDEELTPTINTESKSEINLTFEGLEDLGDDYAYEGWLIVDGNPVSTGIFSVDTEGRLSQTTFELNTDDVANATNFVLTIEPSPDPDPAPSSVHILAGNIENDSAVLSVEHPAAIGTDFVDAAGNYILATPTDGGSDTNETSGVWWLSLESGSPTPGLSLPSLAEGWIYEGWAVVDGTPISTGRFLTAEGADDFDGHSGSVSGPPFPGEDLLVNAPQGLSFPVDLSGKTVVISVEPVPDNSPAPFLLKPLVSMIPTSALDHADYSMENNATATNPTGTFNITQ